ncbi:acyl-[acyl-carrier-protein]--UDP-N-acetylglucosamine O-acyltransferase, partial [Campylobacter coli]
TVVGGLTPIHQFVKVGEGCMIAGASALSQDIVPFCLAEGNRAIYLLGLSILLSVKESILHENVEYPEQYYKGEYIADLAKEAFE